MSITEHKKLVRTKIPGIINQNGEGCSTRTISGKELTTALINKLEEETNELLAATTPQDMAAELADVYEVVEAVERHVLSEQEGGNQELEARIAHVRQMIKGVEDTIPGVDVASIKAAKLEERGGFLLDCGRGIFLEWSGNEEQGS